MDRLGNEIHCFPPPPIQNSCPFLGCQIYSYDHTVNFPARRGQNIRFHQTGLGQGEQLKTLKNIFAENGHQDKRIQYLKVFTLTCLTVRLFCRNHA